MDVASLNLAINKEDGIGIGLGRISERFLVSFPKPLASESEVTY